MTTETFPLTGRRAAARTHKPLGARVQRAVGPWARMMAKVVLISFMVLAAAAFLFLAVGPRLLGYQTSTMLTGSMAPMINPGDVVVSVPTPVAELTVGDVVTYHIPVDDHRIETHRIIDVSTAAGTTTVQTKGDANNGADPWTATMSEDHAFTTVAVIPHLGDAIRTLRSPAVGKALLYGAPALLVLLLLSSIWARPETDDAAVEGKIAGPAAS